MKGNLFDACWQFFYSKYFTTIIFFLKILSSEMQTIYLRLFNLHLNADCFFPKADIYSLPWRIFRDKPDFKTQAGLHHF